MPENILFGAEFEEGGIRKGAAEIVAQLKQVQEANETLKASSEALREENKKLEKANDDLSKNTTKLKESNEAGKKAQGDLRKEMSVVAADIKKQEAELDKLNKKVAAGNGLTKEQQTQYSRIKALLPQLNKDYADLNSKLESNNKKLSENAKEIKNAKAAIESNNASIKQNSEAVRTNEAEQKKNNATLSAGKKLLKELGEGGADAFKGVSKLYSGLKTMANILPGLGIAGLIGLIYEFGEKAVEAFIKAAFGADEFAKRQKAVNEIFADAAKASGQQVAQMEVFKAKLNDLSIPEKERITVAKEYNKIADEQNKIDTKQINNLVLINKHIAAQTELIIQRAVALSATAKLGTFADKFVDAELKMRDAIKSTGLTEEQAYQKIIALNKELSQQTTKKQGALGILLDPNETIGADQAVNNIKKVFGPNGAIVQQLIEGKRKARKELDDAGKMLGDLITVPGITKHEKETKDKKAPENVFAEKLAELRARLASAQVAEFQSEPLIRAKFDEQLNKEFADIAKLIKDKRLTIAQGDILRGLLRQINEVDLSKSLGEFRRKAAEAMDKVNAEIQAAALDASTKRVANIRDEFEREGQQIELSFTTTVAAIQDKLTQAMKGVDEAMRIGTLTRKQGQTKKGLLQLAFGELIDAAEGAKINAQIDLAFKTFQNTIKESQRAAEALLVSTDEGTAERIAAITQKFFAGLIPYTQYQKELTRITREGANARNELRLAELRKELEMVNAALATTTDIGNRKKLEDQALQIRAQIASIRNQINGDAAKDENDRKGEALKHILEYATAVQGLLSSVASFWQQVNAVEQASLERSIALQQRRVDNAKDIAEKGNAEYLEMERKRMDDLERKREESAKKQMAINAALTLSNATVAAVGAIAQAVSTGNPLLAIGALASVIAAIGAAFAFANSLTPPTPTFYQGEEYVDDPRRPRGKDTIHARLHIGERVVPTDTNMEYWDALSAIQRREIPAEVINQFVANYPDTNIPRADMGRLSAATSSKFNFDSLEIAREQRKTNDLLNELITVAGAEKINLKLDSEGFAASVAGFLSYQEKIKKA